MTNLEDYNLVPIEGTEDFKLIKKTQDLRYSVGDEVYVSSVGPVDVNKYLEIQEVSNNIYFHYTSDDNRIFFRDEYIDHEKTKAGKEKIWAENGMFVGDDDNVSNYFIDEQEGISSDQRQATLGICFKTKEKCQSRQSQMQALKAIRKWKTLNDGDFVPDWSDESELKFYMGMDMDSKNIGSNYCKFYNNCALTPYFSSFQIVQKCIEECKSEWETLFDV